MPVDRLSQAATGDIGVQEKRRVNSLKDHRSQIAPALVLAVASVLPPAAYSDATSPAEATAPVTATDLGAEMRLENGLISATINKSSAQLVSLKLGGAEVLGNGGKGYLQVVADGRFSIPEEAEFRVVQGDGRHVDASHRWQVGPLEFDWHYVLRAGDSGIYCYLWASYDPRLAPACEIQQLSYALRTDKQIFHRMYVDDGRVFDMPAPEEVAAGATLIPREATRLDNGAVDHKYHYSKCAMDDGLHGWTGHGLGHWIITPSNESINGGPTNQELTVHQSKTTPVTLKVMHGAHYGSGTTALDSTAGKWQKLFGPWLMYFNEGDDGQALADAKRRLAEEQGAWPYGWLNHDAYPQASQRGRVVGKLCLAEGGALADALVVLAQPTDGAPETNWQRQGKGYIFWALARADGRFEINHVRPGTYTLYALKSGILGEYRRDGVEVSPGTQQALGELVWKPKRHGELVWQIGVPDRSAAEYRHGDDFRQWGLWRAYPQDFPQGVRYVVGQSTPEKDWNFNQWCLDSGADDAGRRIYASSPWTIEFELDKIYDGTAYLTVAIAAAREARLRVQVNGVEVFAAPLASDAAAPRAGIRGFYQQHTVMFDASLLKSNETNRITLEQRRTGLFSSIMYDCIRLELGGPQ